MLAGCSAPAAEQPDAAQNDPHRSKVETISGAEWCQAVWQGEETWPAGPLLIQIVSLDERSQPVVEDYIAMDEVISEWFNLDLPGHERIIGYRLEPQSADGPDPQLIRDIFVWYRQTFYDVPDASGGNIGQEAAMIGLADVYNQCRNLIDLPELGLGEDKTHVQEALYMALYESGRLEQDSESSQCELDFQRAAEVPLAQSNDEVLSSTLTSCPSVDQWKEALREHPAVLGVDSVSDAEVDLSFEVLCANWGAEASLCQRGE